MELLKELKSLEEAREHKVIDIWLLTLVFMNSEYLQKSVEKLFKKKILDGCLQDHMFDQCVHGIIDLPKVLEHFNNNSILDILVFLQLCYSSEILLYVCCCYKLGFSCHISIIIGILVGLQRTKSPGIWHPHLYMSI